MEWTCYKGYLGQFFCSNAKSDLLTDAFLSLILFASRQYTLPIFNQPRVNRDIFGVFYADGGWGGFKIYE